MKSLSFSALVSIVALGLLPAAASAAGLKEDMIALDRAYIPALAITNRNPQPDDAKRAMEPLNRQWAGFKQKHLAAGDRQWQADMEKIDGLIVAANRIVDSGKDFARAHEELEGVRLTFLEMRQRTRMPYYLDDLTRFHDPMEEIYLAAKGKTADTLTDADIAKIKSTFPGTEKLWATVRSAKVDPAFRLTPEKRDEVDRLLANESRALDALKQALASGDRAAIAKSAQGIRGPFAALYVAFGDFAALEKK
jgi:hypothetical protein